MAKSFMLKKGQTLGDKLVTDTFKNTDPLGKTVQRVNTTLAKAVAKTHREDLDIPMHHPRNDLFRGRDKSLWDFWKHGVTSSFLGAFLQCREQTRLSFVEGLKSRHVPIYFEFGTCCHWILEQAYSPKGLTFFKVVWTYDTAHEMVIKWVADRVSEYEKKWLAETKQPSNKQLEQQELCYGMAEAILPTYFLKWDGDFTGKYTHRNPTTKPVEWDSLEEVFRIPYTFPDGRQTWLNGRRDGVFISDKKKVWVFDSKCRSVINHEDALETLPTDLQQMLYMYVTSEQRKAKKLKPEYPTGVIMNIIRRPGHRRGVDESLKDFLSRIRSDVGLVKKYDHNFVRYEMAVTPGEIDTWKREQLDPMMLDVRAWWEGTAPHYMNPNALISKYGRCEMFLPIVHKDFTHCYKRDVVFSELAEGA